MCAAIDMLASEHFFGRSPPAGFLTDYTPQRRLSTRGYSAPCLSVLTPIKLTFNPATRSCLKIQSDKSKKKVVFADDRGLALEQVKFMTEPSHVPPYWALKLVSSPPAERKPPPQIDTWEAKFVQPASDYVEFRRRITQDYVALENVIIRQKEGSLDGTVKVKNLDFTKEVFVRHTSDGWRTNEDTYCAFVESGPFGNNGASVYDTFGFSIQMPVHSRRLDFCVCFRCKDQEYWDSNNGFNYTIEKSSVKFNKVGSTARLKYGNSWNVKSEGIIPYW